MEYLCNTCKTDKISHLRFNQLDSRRKAVVGLVSIDLVVYNAPISLTNTRKNKHKNNSLSAQEYFVVPFEEIG